jgi:hypothetical protein
VVAFGVTCRTLYLPFCVAACVDGYREFVSWIWSLSLSWLPADEEGHDSDDVHNDLLG